LAILALGASLAHGQSGGANPPAVFSGISGTGTVDLGAPVTLRMTVNSSIDPGTLTYIWRKDGIDIPGAVGQTYTITAATAAHAGTYAVEVEDAGGWNTATATLTVRPPAPPVITTQPRTTAVFAGQPVALNYVASGSFPRAHQWRKDGGAISGATADTYPIAAASAVDAGAYSVVITNAQGSATSTSATLTVNPAAPPTTATFSPATRMAVAGENVTLALSVFSGSPPLAARWSKNGAVIPGATDFMLRFPSVAESDGGTYTVTLTNSAGAVASNELAFTVRPATPLTLSGPDNQTRGQGEDASFSVSIGGGSFPVKVQWSKDGVALAGRTESLIMIRRVTFADAGNYSAAVTNGAGTVERAAALTVRAAVAPTLRYYTPVLELREGESGGFNLAVDNDATGPLTYQWYKSGGLLVSRASGSFSPARPSDAGDYELKVTGAGGVLTLSMNLVVLPPAPPVAGSFSRDPVRIGDAVGVGSGSSRDPASAYQWFNDGWPIAGATGPSFTIDRVAVTDLARYKLVAANDGGVVALPSQQLRTFLPGDRLPFGNSTPPDPKGWLGMGRVGNIVYALALAPNRIERYDLAAERWLAVTPLSDPRTPAAFLATPQGIFIAYGGTLARRPLDLATETTIASSSFDITRLAAAGDWLYYDSSVNATAVMVAVHRTTLQPGATTPASYSDMTFSSRTNLGYGLGLGTSAMGTFVQSANGAITSPTPTDFGSTYTAAPRLFLFPNEDLITSGGGTIYRASNLGYVGSFGGVVTDLALLGDGAPVVLRNERLELMRATDFFRQSSLTLPFVGARVFAVAPNLFVFGTAESAGGAFRVHKVSATAFATPPPIPLTVAAGERLSIDDVFLGRDGVVHVFSRSKQALIRWSANSRQYLAPVPLRGDPTRYAHAPGAERVLFAYQDGVVTEVPLGSGAAVERQIGSVGNGVLSLTDLGDATLVRFFSASSTALFRMSLGRQGEFNAAAFAFSGSSASPLVWLPGARRLYSLVAPATFNSGALEYEAIPDSAVITSRSENVARFPSVVRLPIRFNPEETLFVSGDGQIGNANLATIASLASSLTDAAWLADALLTMRDSAGDTEVQRWARNNYQRTGSIVLRGTPVRIFRLSDARTVVVTSVRGFVRFTVLNSDLSIVPPPAVADLTGVYVGQLGGGAGDVAVLLRADRTGVLLALRPPNTGLIARDFALELDGTFVAIARELTVDRSHAFGGAVVADGTMSGTIAGWNLSFSATKTSGASPLGGFYAAPLTNTLSTGDNGTAYAIVGADGRGLAVAHNSSLVVGGIALVNAANELNVTATDGSRVSATLQSDSGAMTVTANRAALTGTYSGLRDDVPSSRRLLNISTRGRVGADAMIAGFVVSGTAPRTMLVRAIGPSLAALGLSGALVDARLTLYRSETQLGESDNWGAEPAAADIAAAALRVGAFPLPANSRDAALLMTLDPGSYTALVSGVGGASGVALVEVYDTSATDSTATRARLINIATRGAVGVAEDQLIAGIVVAGNAPTRVLIRAVGPGLRALGVGGALRDPVLTLRDATGAIATNDDWSGGSVGTTTDLLFASAAVGAFPLTIDSRDACILITLRPGNYTAQISGKGGSTGVALVEIYEIND